MLNFTPVIFIAGQAGSGKDTVASYLAENYRAACVAQADPMKRFARAVFNFTEDQLWGPSESRNAVDQGTVDNLPAIKEQFAQIVHMGRDGELLGRVVPPDQADRAQERLEKWFADLCRNYLDVGTAVSPRLVLQTLGTEWGRAVSRDMWSFYALEVAHLLVCGGYRYSRLLGLEPDAGFSGYEFSVIMDGRFRNEVLNARARRALAIRMVRPQADAKAVEAAGIKGHASEKELGGIPAHFFDHDLFNNSTFDDLFIRTRGLMERAYNVRIPGAIYHYVALNAGD
jgi:hypothetical protein